MTGDVGLDGVPAATLDTRGALVSNAAFRGASPAAVFVAIQVGHAALRASLGTTHTSSRHPARAAC